MNNPKYPTFSDNPAFACASDGHHQMGLTKREYFAAMAMQGLLQRQEYLPRDADVISPVAVQAADALIEALNTEEKHDDD